ncbi:MAG TPA: pyridoxamine 5'-phosphate oxidase family protein [Patescibacteria group bacterium]|nr:pyridoxamine 5'-phosphate oxidase family protein [Patescibacteria group bacterium]
MEDTSPNYTKIMTYIDRNPAAVLSTVNEDGAPHGAVVYICTTSHRNVCFVTKNLTRKFGNIAKHPQVSLTFFNEKEGTTLQASGNAFVADNPEMINYVLDKMNKMHAMQAGWVPPVTKLDAGEYAVIGIELQDARLADYSTTGIGNNEATYTEL